MDEGGDSAQFQRGRNDRAAGLPFGGGPSALHTAVYDDSVAAGGRWGENPGKELRRMLFRVARYTIVAGAVGFGVALLAGPNWFKSPVVTALQWGGVVFFLISVLPGPSWSERSPVASPPETGSSYGLHLPSC
jgi:hypothetical protein